MRQIDQVLRMFTFGQECVAQLGRGLESFDASEFGEDGTAFGAAASVALFVAATMRHPEWAQGWLREMGTFELDGADLAIESLVRALPLTAVEP